MDKQETTQDVSVRKVPTALWKRIKAIAFTKDKTIRKVVCDALTLYADRME